MSTGEPEATFGVPKKKRSPQYPAITLEVALRRASEFLDEFDEHPGPLDGAAAAWTTTVKSSGFLQIVSSLKQFGLMTDEGSNDDRLLKLTPAALDILAHEEDSAERRRLIQIAALSPKVHRELWDKFGPKLPQSDSPLKLYLTRQREGATFNRDAVDAFISDFRKSISYARLGQTDTIQVDDEPSELDDEGTPDVNATLEMPKPAKPQGGAPPPTSGLKDFPLYTAGQKGALYVPATMTEADFALLKQQLDAYLMVIKATSVSAN